MRNTALAFSKLAFLIPAFRVRNLRVSSLLSTVLILSFYLCPLHIHFISVSLYVFLYFELCWRAILCRLFFFTVFRLRMGPEPILLITLSMWVILWVVNVLVSFVTHKEHDCIHIFLTKTFSNISKCCGLFYAIFVRPYWFKQNVVVFWVLFVQPR